MSGLVLVLGRRFPHRCGCRAVPATSLGAGPAFSLAAGLGLFAWVSGGPLSGLAGFAAGLAHGQVPHGEAGRVSCSPAQAAGPRAFPAPCC